MKIIESYEIVNDLLRTSIFVLHIVNSARYRFLFQWDDLLHSTDG